jgi:Domain of unknown function (DUF4136)
MTLLPPFSCFTRWYERRHRTKAFDRQLATLLTLVLKFPVTTALVYSQEVHYNCERGVTFSAYKTYQWVEIPAAAIQTYLSKIAGNNSANSPANRALPGLPAPPASGVPRFPGGGANIRDGASEDQLINQDIRRAIDEQLAQKGLVKVDKNADVIVAYHAAIRQEQSVFLSGSGWGGRGMGGKWDGSVQGQTSSVPVGTIVVDLYDTTQNQLVWRGDATKTIDLKKDPDKNYRSLQKAMARLFKNYPPQQGN